MITAVNITPVTQAQILTIMSLVDAKFQLKIDHDYEDDLITSYVEAAFSQAEDYLGSSIVETYAEVFTNKQFTSITLPVYNVTAVNQVSYTNTNDANIIIPASDYTFVIDQGNVTIEYTGLDITDLKADSKAIKITVTTGFNKIPVSIIQAIKLIMSDMYEYRSNRLGNFANSVAANLMRKYKQFV